MDPIKQLKDRGFLNPTRIQDLSNGNSFYITPKGELYKVLSIKKTSPDSLFYNILTESYIDHKRKPLKLSGGVWVDLELNPNEALNGSNEIKSRCVKALLDFFNTKKWRIVDEKGVALNNDFIYSEFYKIDAEGDFKKAFQAQ